MSSQVYHIPVMLSEVVDYLAVKPDGIYVDCTFGGGGHSKAILEKLDAKGKLFVFDQDENARQNLPADQRIIFISQNFRHLRRFLRLHDIEMVDGIVADLGVSSHQLDEPGRGFSIRFEGDMDMRMDKRLQLTAYDVVNTYSEQRLHQMFEQYGEVTNARTLAKTIVEVRGIIALKTTEDFKTALRKIVKGNPNRYFAQVFQALRIEVNDELGALKELLQQIPAVLKTGGRVVIITFHSLEDRLVKNFFRRGLFEAAEEDPFVTRQTVNQLKVITKKPVTPSTAELKTNPRSRSARLRVAEKMPA
jgi:16S rRNA (cytosine1402-N4)-methyltransferase